MLSLTERADNLVMWAHYTAEHRGFVIGLDSEHLWFERDDEPRMNVLAKVRYVNERPARGLIVLSNSDTFFCKSPHWAYEAEWRVFRLLAMADQCIDNGNDPIHLFCFPPSLITKVIIGCRATAETRQAILELLHADDLRHVVLQEARLDENS